MEQSFSYRAGQRRNLPNVEQLCEGVNPNNPIEHIVVCPLCGQMFDCRDQGAVRHHSRDKHNPQLRKPLTDA